ncbi:MAG: beta-aspartyl-peptidase [Bacteroidales bacterium]|nr:beta-aspartyl-peptidase [Bacteroidales bacterium]MDD4670448.1 beta-aspartyl-peptidase [Bacteroidales bacterium]
MITLIKNAKIYSPNPLKGREILISDGTIAAISDKITLIGCDINVVDASGCYVCPGFIDEHVHITGGGGQMGHSSFIPEVTVADLAAVGTTTVLGLLGTDGFVKELSTLYSKTKALDEQGITAYMLTSYYGLPEKTITGSIAEDMIFIDKVIGCKLAMSDDRSSFPTEQEVLRLVNQVRLGGFTSGKHGILHIHLGNLSTKIDIILSIIDKYPTLITYFSPTHTIRTRALFDDCVQFAKKGGMIDISTGGTKFTEPHLAVGMALEMGVPLENMAFSSDGRGGVRRENPQTGEITYTPAPLDLNYKEFVCLVRENILPLEQALMLLTSNPARNLSLKRKGKIAVGADADFVFLDENLSINSVYAKGKNITKR